MGVSFRIWAYLGASGCIWAHIGVSGRIWAYLGASGRIWAHVARFWSFFYRFACVCSLLSKLLSSYPRAEQIRVPEKGASERSELEARKAMTGDSEEQWATTRLLPKRAELPLECPTASIRF